MCREKKGGAGSPNLRKKKALGASGSSLSLEKVVLKGKRIPCWVSEGGKGPLGRGEKGFRVLSLKPKESSWGVGNLYCPPSFEGKGVGGDSLKKKEKIDIHAYV